MKESPLLTLCIFTYKRPKMLERALRCALEQTNKNFQICVFDDASGDETPSIVAHYQQMDSRIHYVCREHNVGIITGVWLAIQHVTTPYFALIADDDFILPYYVEHHLKLFSQHPELGASMANNLRWFDDGSMSVSNLREGLYEPVDAALAATDPIPFLGATVLALGAVKSIGMIRRELGNAIDLDLIFRIALEFPVYISNRVVISVHIDMNTNTMRALHKETVKDSLTLLKFYRSVSRESERLQIADTPQSIFNSWFAGWLQEAISERCRNSALMTDRLRINFYFFCFQPDLFLSWMIYRYPCKKLSRFMVRKKKQIQNMIRVLRRQPKPPRLSTTCHVIGNECEYVGCHAVAVRTTKKILAQQGALIK